MTTKKPVLLGDRSMPDVIEIPSTGEARGVTFDTTVKRLQTGIKPAKPASSFDLRDSKTFGVR